ncbi:MAG: ABC transporter permease [Planctomycetes bacterium]|nr:ABC transporter permease [Planctomycetota bacterium]
MVFFVMPLGILAAISFLRPGSPVEWSLTAGNYGRLLDPLLLKVFLRSLVMAAAATAVCLAIGYPMAYFMARQPPRLQKLLYFLTLIPLWANSLALTYAWMVLLRSDGVLERGLRWAGAIGPADDLRLLYTPASVVLGLVYWYLPFMVYPLYASLEKFDWRLLDAAMDLGATRWTALHRVMLPLTMPGIIGGCLLVFIPALGNFVVPQLMGGAKQALIGNVIQERFLSQPQDWPLGSALAMTMMVLVTAAVWAYFRYAREEHALG